MILHRTLLAFHSTPDHDLWVDLGVCAKMRTPLFGAPCDVHAESRECDRYMFLHVDVCVCAGAEKNLEMPRFVSMLAVCRLERKVVG